MIHSGEDNSRGSNKAGRRSKGEGKALASDTNSGGVHEVGR